MSAVGCQDSKEIEGLVRFRWRFIRIRGEGMKRRDGWSQSKEGEKNMNPGDLQSARESGGQTNGHAYGGKETQHSVGVFLIC
jgi:hypothetical protein